MKPYKYELAEHVTKTKAALEEMNKLLSALYFLKSYVEAYKTKSGQYRVIRDSFVYDFYNAYFSFRGFKNETDHYTQGCSLRYRDKYDSGEPGSLKLTRGKASLFIKIYDIESGRIVKEAPQNVEIAIKKLSADIERQETMLTPEKCDKWLADMLAAHAETERIVEEARKKFADICNAPYDALQSDIGRPNGVYMCVTL